MTAQLPSKERTEQIANFHRTMSLPPSHAEIEALARYAMAGMEQEPVGYFGRFCVDDEDMIDQCSPNIKGAFPLYAAPVVS